MDERDIKCIYMHTKREKGEIITLGLVRCDFSSLTHEAINFSLSFMLAVNIES